MYTRRTQLLGPNGGAWSARVCDGDTVQTFWLQAAASSDASGTSLTDWLQGGGTVVAVAFSILSLGLEVRRRRYEAAAQRRRQASRVLAWVDAKPTGVVGTSGDGTRFTEYEMLATVRNFGDEPVWGLGLVLLSNEGRRLEDRRECDLLLPGAEWNPLWRTFSIPDEAMVPTDNAPRARASVRLFFDDVDGRRWQREKSKLIRA